MSHSLGIKCGAALLHGAAVTRACNMLAHTRIAFACLRDAVRLRGNIQAITGNLNRFHRVIKHFLRVA
jgi:hypothetical protein